MLVSIDLLFSQGWRRSRRRLCRLRLSGRSPLCFNQLLRLLRYLITTRKIDLSIEKDLAFDQCHLHAGIDTERMSIEDRQIGILPDVDTADAAVDLELFGRIECHKAQGLLV